MHRPLGVVYPESCSDVQAVLACAARWRVPVYPISRGQNWGYGDAGAPTDGQVVVDLSRMNRVLEINRRHAYVVIEPGVSQGQLAEALLEQDLWLDVTGAGPNASIVGNTLDRGFGHTPYSDHLRTACGLEVVLADGTVLKTGFGHYGNARATRHFPYGVGPFLDGLFSQSNYGVVTQLGLWVMPRPESFCAYFFSAPRQSDLRELVDALAPLRLRGYLTSAVHIANDLRILSGRTTAMQAGVSEFPANRALVERLRTRYACRAWNGCGALYGSATMVAAIRAELRKVLAPFNLRFVTEKTVRAATRLAPVLARLGVRGPQQQLEGLLPIYRLLRGIPSPEPLRGVYWRAGASATDFADPARDGVGLMWVSPILPCDGEAADDVFRLLKAAFENHGFELFATYTMLNERAIAAVTNILFRRDRPDEVRRAEACFEVCYEALLSAGYPPYRTGPPGYSTLRRAGGSFWEVCDRVKDALDPLGIIAPGRYAIGCTHQEVSRV